MKHLLVLFVIVLVSTGILFGGEPKTKSGDKAFLFTIGGLGNFDIGSSQLVSVTYLNSLPPSLSTISPPSTTTRILTGAGGKCYLSDNVALRGTLNFSLLSESQNVTGGENKGSETTFGISPGIEWHFVKSGAVTGYWGGMFQYGWAQVSSTPAGSSESKASGTIVGLAALAGVEFFPWDEISLGAEYQLGFNSTSTKFESGAISVDGPSITNFGIQNYSVSLAVYL